MSTALTSPREATNRVQNSMAGPWEPPYQKKLYRPERGAHDTGWQKGWGGRSPLIGPRACR